ncbi:MAG: hypothetical protein IPP79_17980 [Chitinophagaceae bacterium]|nr:hypothetical protein [Chitinophagaceae bacterium]
MNVFESPDSIYLGPDITLCKISTYTFNAGSGFKSYLWQDGSTDSTLTIYLPGTYHVTAEDYCGNKYRDTVIVTQSPDLPFDLGPDRSICIGDTITITAPAGFNNYNWSPNYKLNNRYSPTVSVSPIVDTTYMVIAEKSPGCLVVDSIRITVKTPSPLYIGKDTSFCQNDTLLINATPGFSTYQWNTGATSSSIKVTTAGNFSLIATDANGCRSKDTLTVLSLFPVPVVNLDNTSTLCDNIKRILDAGQHSSYLWQDGSTNRTYSVNNTGTYWVVVKDVNGCHNSDTSIVKNLLLSPSNFLDSSAEICIGQKLEIKAKTGYTSYRWNTNSSASLITVTSPGIYWVEVSNTDGCSARDTISVKAKDCIKVFISQMPLLRIMTG